jgi:hypothetical protein
MAYDNLLESSKLMVETMKHLTTVSVGAILIMVGLLQTVFKAPHWKAVLTISFVGFCLSNLVAVRLMMFCVGHVARGEASNEPTGFYRMASYGFLIGVLCFVGFVLRNLWA